MRRTIYQKTIGLGLLGLAMSGEAWAINDRAASSANANGNICYRQALAPMPDAISRDNVKIVGVSMGQNGEILRYKLKRSVQDTLPSIIGIVDPGFFTQLTADDFELDNDIPAGAETPLDISTAQETVIYYTLLPDTWQFDDIPLSLKAPVEHGRAPFITLPSQPLTQKTAVLYKADQADPLYRYCMYHFNLNVTIAQGVEGAQLYTPIIIDPTVNNNEHPDALTGWMPDEEEVEEEEETDSETPGDTSETAGGN